VGEQERHQEIPEEEKAGKRSLQEQERLPRDSRRGRQVIKQARLINHHFYTLPTLGGRGGGFDREGWKEFSLLRSKRLEDWPVTDGQPHVTTLYIGWGIHIKIISERMR
jgi:hypothetical protein